MNKTMIARAGCLVLLVSLVGCASSGGSVYVPIGSDDRAGVPKPPQSDVKNPDARSSVWRKSEQSAASKPKVSARGEPSYRESGDELPAAALSLIRDAEQLLSRNDAAGAIARLERAQRIAPGSAGVYFKLAEAYVSGSNLGAAEQFTLKGLSLAGNDARMQRSGWLLLADIRRARGNLAGAGQAEDRARAL